MIEQISNSLPFLVFYTESKVGKAGLTVTVDIWRWNGTAWTEIVPAGDAVEIGDGGYYYNLASGSVTVEGAYFAVFKTATTSVDQQHIPSLWLVGKAGVENLDALISSRLSTAGYTAPDNTGIGVAAVAAAAAASGVTALLGRITSALFSGITSLGGWLRLLARKDAAAATDYAASLVEINANGGTGAGGYASTSESLEALEVGIVAGATLVINSTAPVLATLDAAGKLTIHRGDYTTFDLILGNLAGRTGEKLVFTLKPKKDDLSNDSEAYLQVTELTGAVLVNGSSDGVVATDASMVVISEVTGQTRFVFKSDITDLLTVGSDFWYDVQMFDADGERITKVEDRAVVTRDVTRRTA